MYLILCHRSQSGIVAGSDPPPYSHTPCNMKICCPHVLVFPLTPFASIQIYPKGPLKEPRPPAVS